MYMQLRNEMWNITDYLKNINLWAFEIYTYLSLICIWIIFLLGNTYQCLFYESFTKLVNDFYPGKHIMRILTIWLTNLPFSDQPLHRVDQLTPHMGQVGQKRFYSKLFDVKRLLILWENCHLTACTILNKFICLLEKKMERYVKY